MGVELGGCAKCVKYMLIIFNVLFFLAGIGLLAVGIWVVVQPYQFQVLEILDNPLIKNSAYLIIALGCFIIVVAGLGCCGACMSSKCMLVVYFIIILIIFIAQIVGCALVVAFRSDVETFVTDNLATTMDDYMGENSTDPISTGWNAMQILLECCSATNYTDWATSTYYAGGTRTINIGGSDVVQEYPITCCVYADKYTLVTGTDWPEPEDVDGCINSPTSTNLNMGGCVTAFETYVSDQILYIGGVGLGLLVFELLAMIFAIVLCRGISKGEDVV